jgi:hypothetical protein
VGAVIHQTAVVYPEPAIVRSPRRRWSPAFNLRWAGRNRRSPPG